MSNNWNIAESRKRKDPLGVEAAVLVGLIHGQLSETVVKEHLDELAFLAETAGAVTKKIYTQKLDRPVSLSYLGKGKLEEIAAYIEKNTDITMVIFDDDLSPKQLQHLEQILKVKIIDRSSLILDIFAERAQTAQARTQVELAQIQYLLPRLRGLWTHLERQRGGVGMRGPGEQEIETDRRIVRDRIAFLKEKLEKIDRQSQTQRKTRGQMVRVALVGYTNVGKSTLMNTLGKVEVFAENKLFATLDTTVRKVVIDATPFLLSDTVGFIRKLPHHLVESFKSTLDEVRESDILLHVVDIAHPQFEDHVQTVLRTLSELGVADLPMIMVHNKMDLYREHYFDALLDEQTKVELEAELHAGLRAMRPHEAVFISATTGEGIDTLRQVVLQEIRKQYVVRYPHMPRQW
jgi:GTP-binding protein HflX